MPNSLLNNAEIEALDARVRELRWDLDFYAEEARDLIRRLIKREGLTHLNPRTLSDLRYIEAYIDNLVRIVKEQTS